MKIEELINRRELRDRGGVEVDFLTQEMLELEYDHSALIVPRIVPEEAETVAFSQAIVGRAKPQMALELKTPSRDAPSVLQSIGLEDMEELQATLAPSRRQGAFASLSSLGMTVAFFGSESDEAEAEQGLGEEYELVRNFPLYIPARVRLSDVASTIGLGPLGSREWPEESGVTEAHDAGIRGAGVLAGVLDTGIDADHDEFSHQRVPYRYVSLHPSSPYWPPRDVRGFDTDGHGTHVSGILAGRSVGVAPEAKLYAASVIESETTRTSLTRVAYGLDWVLRQFSRPDNEHRPAVLNMSIGFPSTPPPGISTAEYDGRLRIMRTLLQTLVQANVLPVIAIGNNGPGQFGYPGAFRDVFGVGAVDFKSNVAAFSGSGDPPGEGVSKPDLVGFGVGVYSSVERDYDGDSIYRRFSGTSMASPYVAGIAALYRCQQPGLGVGQLVKELKNSAKDLSTQPPDRVGAGLARFIP